MSVKTVIPTLFGVAFASFAIASGFFIYGFTLSSWSLFGVATTPIEYLIVGLSLVGEVLSGIGLIIVYYWIKENLPDQSE